MLVLIFFTSCNGQVKTNLPKDSVTISTGASKIIKTQGTNQYSNTDCGLQDKVGNLWFGTTGEGVYRYDGKLFTQFTVKDGLSNNTVWSILEDKTGNIWFGTDAGLCRYDGKNITSIPITVTNGRYIYSNSPNTNPPTKNAVWSMMQDKSGKLWFGTSDGVYCYNGTFFIRFLDDDSIINKDGLHLKMVDCMLEDKNGIIWFGTRRNGNWLYDGQTFTKYTEKVGIGSPVLVDKAGNIWFSGEEHNNGVEGNGGVWCYGGKFFKNFTTKDGMGNYGVWSIIEDRAGNIWFGTRNNGLYRYDGKIFTSFSATTALF